MSKIKIGIALGGGNALGFAHLGVLGVLEREGLCPDVIAGCSMGSLLGGIYASGCNLQKLTDFANIFNERKYIDFTAPFKRQGFLGGDKVEDLVKTMTEGISIEQAKIPFSCLATCLEDAAPVYFTSGPMYKAIRASISIPGVFDPVRVNGKTLVDGGIYDRSAMTALMQMEADVRIAVDVAYRGTPQPAPESTWQVLSASYEILSWHAVSPHYESAQCLILPDTTQFKSSSYSDIPAIIAAGTKATEEALPNLREVIAQAEETAEQMQS